jgi:hypothetical protein
MYKHNLKVEGSSTFDVGTIDGRDNGSFSGCTIICHQISTGLLQLSGSHSIISCSPPPDCSKDMTFAEMQSISSF